MKYLFILIFALTSQLTLASYHEGGETTPGYDDGGGSYSSGGSAAAIIGIGVIGYYLLREDDEESDEFSSKDSRNNYEINFLKGESNYDSLSENLGYQNEFQINIKYYLN